VSAVDQLSRLGPYLGRLLEDEYVQEQFGQAIIGLRRSYRRASGRRASDALKDKRLRSQVRETVSSLLKAASALQGKPAKRRRRRFRRALLLAGAGAAAALAWRAKSTNNNQTTWQGGDGG